MWARATTLYSTPLHRSALLCIALHWKALPVGVSGLEGNWYAHPWLTSTAELMPVFVSGVPGEGKLLLPLRPF